MNTFTEEEICQNAFQAVIDNGRSCFERGKVTDMHFIGNDIVASVIDDRPYRVVVYRQDRGRIGYSCNCGFRYGGACEHAVALMLAANSRKAIQVGMELDTVTRSLLSESPDKSQQVSHNETAPQNLSREMSKNPERSDSSPAFPDLLRPVDESLEQPVISEVPPEKPTTRLYLSERDTLLLIEIRFAYFNGTVEFSRYDSTSSRLVTSGDGKVYRITRSRARENLATANLDKYGLIRYQTGTFTPRSDARMWILEVLPLLAEGGCEIYGRENLRTANARKGTPRMSVAVTSSGEGVFDCKVTVSVDGIPATLEALIDAVNRRSSFILLSDGSSGTLPQEWIERFASLFAAFETDPAKGSFIIRQSHLALAGLLYENADEFHADDEFKHKKEALSTFTGVERQEIPADFNCTMRPYQVAGFEWFYFLKQYRFGGCLADDMGLGKTIQTLALLLREKQLCGGQPSIVVVPTSLLFNWQREAKRFAPSLGVLLYHGPERSRYVNVLHMADVVLTSYGTVLRDIEMLSVRKFHYLVLDEAQAIKNPDSRIFRTIGRMNANFRVTLSGTPVENNLTELWAMFSFLNPGMLGTYHAFMRNFIRPIEKERNERAAEVLRRLLFPFILRRTKEQVAKDLPPKNEIVMYAHMLPRQKIFYDITRDTFRNTIARSIENEGMEQSRMRILEGLLRLRQICCHPKLVDRMFTGDSGKFRLLDECIEAVTAEGHRVLIFSQFVKALELLRERTMVKGIRSEILTGATVDRQSAVDRFQSPGGAPVFFISLKAGGTGLNLTAADYVIHIDPWWNPSAENQASDRAYRIGQTKKVFVYKVITKDTIEERVLALQQHKKDLVDSIIKTEASFFKNLKQGDIMELFS